MIAQAFFFVLNYVLVSSMSFAAQEPSAQRSDLRVLLVGHDPAQPFINYAPTEAMIALHQERTGAFEKLLRSHFKEVTVVYANSYVPAMSDSVDVTLFDARPKPIVRRDGETQLYDIRLPADFSKPVLMIAEVSADIGAGIGLKLDWL